MKKRRREEEKGEAEERRGDEDEYMEGSNVQTDPHIWSPV